MSITATTGLSHDTEIDLVGPTVDDDIRRIIDRYGVEAVKEAVKRQTKARRGPRPKEDWPELRKIIEADARNWLAGGDPFSSRTNYSIAKDFADKNAGQSHPATMHRVERKLRNRRVLLTLMRAMTVSRDEYPHQVHIRALEALSDADSDPFWAFILNQAKSNVAEYELKKGETPPAHLSMIEVEEGARDSLSVEGIQIMPRGVLRAVYAEFRSGDEK